MAGSCVLGCAWRGEGEARPVTHQYSPTCGAGSHVVLQGSVLEHAELAAPSPGGRNLNFPMPVLRWLRMDPERLSAAETDLAG